MAIIKVGQSIVLGASIWDFCGTTSQGIFIGDVGIDRAIMIGAPRCQDISGITVDFKLVSRSGTAECNACRPGYLYRSLGTATSNSQGLVSLSHTITQADLDAYNDATSKRDYLKIMACITGSKGQTIVNHRCTENIIIETAAPPPITEATHYLDIYVKPYSWYSPDGAASQIVTKLGDITGTLTNLFKDITDYQYLGTEILTIDNNVVVRVHVKQLSIVGSAVPLLAVVAPLVLKLLVIIILVGVITGWKFTLAGFIEQITGKEYTKKDVTDMVEDTIIPEQRKKCREQFANDPDGLARCEKSVQSGAADGLSDALDIPGIDATTLGIDAKIDACLAQYNIDKDMNKYNSCLDNVAIDVRDDTKAKVPKEPTDLGTLLLYGGLALGGLFIISKGATPVLIERERLMAEERKERRRPERGR